MRSVSPYDEASLLSSLRSGSQKAFDELYDRFAPSLLDSILRVVHQSQQAEDLLQDCFIKIWLNLHHYDPAKGRLYTWMVRIARNLALDQLSKPKERALEELPLERLGSVTPSYHAIGLRYWVNASLSARHRQVIDLVYFQGYTRQEISDEVGLPVGTVKTYLRQALQGLRDSETARGLALFTLTR